MSVIVVVNIESKEGKSSEALEIIKGSQKLCLSTDGCTDFEVLQNQSNENKFLFIERWDSTEIHKLFIEKLKSNENYIKSMEAFTSEPHIEYFNPA